MLLQWVMIQVLAALQVMVIKTPEASGPISLSNFVIVLRNKVMEILYIFTHSLSLPLSVSSLDTDNADRK